METENIISNILSTYQKTQDEIIIKILKRYMICTGNKKVYDMIKNKYGEQVDIRYSEYLSQNDHNVYLLDLDDYKEMLKPITLYYSEPDFIFDPCSYTMKGHCSVNLKAGDKYL